ncbi:MAG: hypothetical protein ACO3PR_07605, partial [Limisphaerales bacterium]
LMATCTQNMKPGHEQTGCHQDPALHASSSVHEGVYGMNASAANHELKPLRYSRRAQCQKVREGILGCQTS